MRRHRPSPARRTTVLAVGACAAAALVAATATPSGAAPGAASSGASGATAATPATVNASYRANDYADGRAMSILPPGENGLVNAADLAKFELTGARPAGSQDQLPKYTGLLHGYPSLTDSGLASFYNDESFGVKPGDITRTEHPGPNVVIYRDTADVPHIYGQTNQAMAFGAGYAQAEDRLFMMDVLRHYGSGTLASFLGASCEFEQMDHDQLLLSAYTPAQAQAQVDNLPAQYGAQGVLAKSMIHNYVAGVNAYLQAARLNPTLMPADYAAAEPGLAPQDWTDADVVSIAGLIGGIFGRGGGIEVTNAALLQYLQKQLGTAAGSQAFQQFRTANDPLAPTTIVRQSFPYEIPGTIDPSQVALPDDAAAPLTGGPTATTPNCNLQKPNPAALSIIDSLGTMPKHMSNALVVNGNHTSDGHPIAVFGPQVSYFAPQILSLLDLHGPDYDASGASFPGTGIVELGRGRDFAWSATSAGSDVIDQRLEVICNPTGGPVDPHGTWYEFDGQCLPMTNETFSETALPKPGGVGAPTVINHEIHLTTHGIVQGWTTARGGQPVAVVNQRSTYNHDVDSVIGFLQWGQPALTHDVASWMAGAAKINYTFNWFYVDDRDTGYYVSGADPIRPSNVDPSLPTWGTGQSEWKGFLADSAHPHQTNPPQGFFVSWNNKPAPGFAAADDQYGYGQVYRSILLVNHLKSQFAAHGGHLTRAQVVQAMEAAASQDLDGVTVVPALLAYLGNRPEPAGVQAMLAQLNAWTASGAHRRTVTEGDAQYESAAAIAIADELVPRLIRAIYDPILAAGGVGGVGSNGGAVSSGYTKLPMQFVNTPNSGGAHLGSSYDGGFEGYLVSTLQQLQGLHPADGFGPQLTTRECLGGPATCATAVDSALLATYNALVQANNGSSDVSTWTASTASAAAKQTMPQFDSIAFRGLGIVGQPNIEWQNRPTFQQVISFPRHRAR